MTTRNCIISNLSFLFPFVLCGCGPEHGPPKVVLKAPSEVPAQWEGRQLYNTPNVYVYAHSDTAAGEADRWVSDVKTYIQRNYHSALEKGIVIVMEPTDAPLARTIDEVHAIKNDPSLQTTRPRYSKSPQEIREKFEQDGVPEDAIARGTALAISPARAQSMGLKMSDATWAMVGPSHQLASQLGMEVMSGALRKHNPEFTEQKARDAVAHIPDLAGKMFEMTRNQPVFVLWVQRRKGWSDDQRREAILQYIKHVLRQNWLPVPSDEELGW